MVQQRIGLLVSSFLLIGFIFALLAGMTLIQGGKFSKETIGSTIGTISPTLPEREIAIEAARVNGYKTYSFTAHFTPGIGNLSAAQQINQQQLSNK